MSLSDSGSITAFVPRSVKLLMMKKMTEKKQEEKRKKEQKMESEKVIKEALKNKSKVLSESGSTSSKSDREMQIRRSCLQEQAFAKLCQEDRMKKAEEKNSSSNSSSSKAQYDRRYNSSRHHERSKPNHSQAAPRSNGYRQHNQENSSPNLSNSETRKNGTKNISYHQKDQEKSKQKHYQAPLKSHQDSQEKSPTNSNSTESQNYRTRQNGSQEKSPSNSNSSEPQNYRPRQNGTSYFQERPRQTQASSRETAYSFSVPLKSFPSKLYEKSSSESESSNSKPSFILLEDRPLEDPRGKSFGCENPRPTNTLQRRLSASSESDRGSLAMALEIVKDYQKKSAESASDEKMNESEESVKLKSSPETFNVKTKKKDKNDELDTSAGSTLSDVVSKKAFALHLREPPKNHQSASEFYQNHGELEPIDWDVIRSNESTRPDASTERRENSSAKLISDTRVNKSKKDFKSSLLEENLVSSKKQSKNDVLARSDELREKNKDPIEQSSSYASKNKNIKEPKEKNLPAIKERSKSEKSPKSDRSTLGQFSSENTSEKVLEQESPNDQRMTTKFYQDSGTLVSIDWDKIKESPEPRTENHTSIVFSKNKEPNEMLTIHSQGKPDANVDAKEFINFVENTTNHQTVFESRGNLEMDPKVTLNQIERIQKMIHANDWNVCYLPKEMQTVFKKNLQVSSVSVTHVIDYTQAKRTPNALPVKAVQVTPKKQSRNFSQEKERSIDTTRAKYEEELLKNSQAMPKLESENKNYKRAVFDYDDELFDFERPNVKTKSSNSGDSETKRKFNDSTILNSTINSTIDSDDVSVQRSSELDDSENIRRPQPSVAKKSEKFKALKGLLGVSSPEKSTKAVITNTNTVAAAAQENILNIIEENDFLSPKKKCTKYLSECINESEIEEKPIKIEEIIIHRREELLRPVSTRYFAKERENKQKNEDENASKSLIQLPTLVSEDVKEESSGVPRKIIEIISEDVQEDEIEEKNNVKPCQSIFSDSSENNPKSISEDDSDSENGNLHETNDTKASSVIIKEIESDSELDKIEDKVEPVARQAFEREISLFNQSQSSDDHEELEGFDVVGNFLEYMENPEGTKKMIDDFKENIFKNVEFDISDCEKSVTLYRDIAANDSGNESATEPINENDKNLQAEASGISNRKKKKLEWMSKARDRKQAEEK